VISSKKAQKSKIYKLDLLKLDPKIIADQLTVYEFRLYAKITPQQCLTYVKTPTGNDAAKLRDFCSTHDKLGAWVKMSILNGETTGKRAHTVDFWIKVAEACPFNIHIFNVKVLINHIEVSCTQ
jgi:son of sevenless